MDISALRTLVPGTFVPDLGSNDETPNVSAIPATGDSGVTSFKDTVKQMLSDVNDKITASDQNTQDLSTGKTNDLDKVVTSVEEANLALQYTIAVRQKLLDAYNSVANMQI